MDRIKEERLCRVGLLLLTKRRQLRAGTFTSVVLTVLDRD